jgi:hypothetical protein
MSIRTQQQTALLILGLLFMTACFRAGPERLQIDLPEADSADELRLIREALLSEQDLLPEGVVFYHSIEASMEPKPHLILELDPRHLRRQNVYYKIHKMGYSVGGRTGDPDARLEFLTRALLP